MKSEPHKDKKQRQTENLKTKPVCGTLTYLAEGRGIQQKAASCSKETPPSVIGRTVRT